MLIELARAEDWLNALEGVTYLVDANGRILAVGDRGWREAIEAAGFAGPAPDEVVGRSLFEIIDDETVRRLFTLLHGRVVDFAGKSLTYEYRCDAPHIERLMKMSMGAVTTRGRLVGVLYQSTMLSSKERVPLPFLSTSALRGEERRREGLPVVRVCQFCARVASDAWPGEWVEPAAYYARGGNDDIRLGYGVCPSCDHNLVSPLIGGWRMKRSAAGRRSAK